MLKPSDVPSIVAAKDCDLEINAQAIDIFEGNLSSYLDKELNNQLSVQSYIQARLRMAPVNLMPKIIDKLTNIYQTTVVRTVSTEKDSDKNLLEYYVKETQMNDQMNANNELYNLNRCSLLQPYVHNQKPRLRSIPNDKFVVCSTDPVEPNNPTDVILIYKKPSGEKFFWVYNKDTIYACTGDGKIDYDLMREKNMVAGEYGEIDFTNPIGRLPFVYANSCNYSLMPKPDRDGLSIVKLVPLMLTDLNYAAMFQCFSIIYMIDADDKGLKYAPNAVWHLESKPGSDRTPVLDSIKPQVDYGQVLELIQTQLSLWLGSRGVRASTIGGLNKDNFASGISKVIDEMDTFEARQKQVTAYSEVEADYWDLMINGMHPYWVNSKMIEPVGTFTPNCKVDTTFAVQLPMQTRGQVVTDLQVEYQSGFISRRSAIQKLNPELDADQLTAFIDEIDEERTVEVPQTSGGAASGVAAD